jgi:hypothetical protein
VDVARKLSPFWSRPLARVACRHDPWFSCGCLFFCLVGFSSFFSFLVCHLRSMSFRTPLPPSVSSWHVSARKRSASIRESVAATTSARPFAFFLSSPQMPLRVSVQSPSSVATCSWRVVHVSALVCRVAVVVDHRSGILCPSVPRSFASESDRSWLPPSPVKVQVSSLVV